VTDENRLARYLRSDELHLAFNFRLVLTHFDADALRTAIERSLTVPAVMGAPATWTLATTTSGGRSAATAAASRACGGRGRWRWSSWPCRARSTCTTATSWPGERRPAARGDGRPAREDGGAAAGRDVSRVPLPWEGDLPPFGFSRNPRTWLPMPAEWASLTVEKQLEDEDSTLSLYRHALDVRRRHPAFRGDALDWYGAPAGCFAFRRRGGASSAL